jgi:predicted HNH restriction endonuclease
MYKCENCGCDHDGNYGSGRFCSKTCARCFSTKEKRKEINEKVSSTLIKKLNTKYSDLTSDEIKKIKEAKKHASYESNIELKTIFQLSKRTISKIFKRMCLPCSICGWFFNNVACDIHHITPKKNGGTDEHTNLTYVCPNCHRLIHSGKINPKSLVSLVDYIGDEWKKFYFIKKIL